MQNLKMLLFALVAMMLLSVVGADLLTVTTMVTSTSCTKKTITASNPVLTGTTSDFLIRPPTTKQTLSASITLVTPESPKPAEYSFMPTFNAPPLPQPSPCIDNHSWKCIDFRSYTYSYDPATLTPVSGTFTVASRALATETPVDGFIPPPTQAMLQCYYSQKCQSVRFTWNYCNDGGKSAHTCLCSRIGDTYDFQYHVLSCASCIAKALNPVINIDVLGGSLKNSLANYCYVANNPLSQLLRDDQYFSPRYHSPILFFNGTLIPYPFKTTTGLVAGDDMLVARKEVDIEGKQAVWTSLPASNAMLECQAGSWCFAASLGYSACTKHSPIASTHDCFCANNGREEWYEYATKCAACVAAALPTDNGAASPPDQLAATVGQLIDYMCVMQTLSKDTIDYFGRFITKQFKSPVSFYDMSLLTAPITSIEGRDEPKIELIQERDTLVWESIPASDAMKACRKSAGCEAASKLYKSATTTPEVPIFFDPYTNLCSPGANHNQWHALSIACAACVAAALPAVSDASFKPFALVETVGMLIDYLCSDDVIHTAAEIESIGRAMTVNFRSPVLF